MKKKSGMKDEQFNKGRSYNEDDGNAISGVGSADQGDQQNNKSNGANLKRGQGKLSKRPVDEMDFNVDTKKPAAHQIMTTISKVLMKPPQKNQPGQGKLQPKKMSGKDRASSKSQDKSFDDTEASRPDMRAKSQQRGFIGKKIKPAESKPGSKTAAMDYKGKDKGNGKVK